MAEIEGFRLATCSCSLLAIGCRRRNAAFSGTRRIFHSYFLVFERDASAGGGGAELGAESMPEKKGA